MIKSTADEPEVSRKFLGQKQRCFGYSRYSHENREEFLDSFTAVTISQDNKFYCIIHAFYKNQ